jgi:hypothetical protein
MQEIHFRKNNCVKKSSISVLLQHFTQVKNKEDVSTENVEYPDKRHHLRRQQLRLVPVEERQIIQA